MSWGIGDVSKWLSDSNIWGSTGDATVVDSSSNKQLGGGMWSKDLLGSGLQAALGLAGTYFDQSGKKQLAEQYAQQQLAEIAAQKEIAEMQAGKAVKIAKLNNLGSLYNNYAALTERGGEAAGNSALQTGQNTIAAINARAGRL